MSRKSSNTTRHYSQHKEDREWGNATSTSSQSNVRDFKSCYRRHVRRNHRKMAVLNNDRIKPDKGQPRRSMCSIRIEYRADKYSSNSHRRAKSRCIHALNTGQWVHTANIMDDGVIYWPWQTIDKWYVRVNMIECYSELPIMFFNSVEWLPGFMDTNNGDITLDSTPMNCSMAVHRYKQGHTY